MSDRSKAYTKAGVSLSAAADLVDRIKSIASGTHVPGVVSEIGDFGGLFRLDLEEAREPVLVASTDGVGTKVKLAAAFDKHDGIGIDLVAMSVNDVLVQGAKPLFFLDYFATGALDVGQAAQVIASVAEGCKEAGCALLGGETAEMPDIYARGEYDLAGFCVGVVDDTRIVDGSEIQPGHVVIGLASSGIHSNGYSLVRKILDKSGLGPEDTLPGTAETVRDVLLEPTVIYVRPVRNLLRDFEIKGMVHITGGGFYDNIPRVLPHGVQAHIRFGGWDIPPVFNWIKDTGNLSWPEMLQIFNCGIGFVLIVEKDVAQDVVDRLEGMKQKAWIIGEIVPMKPGSKEERVRIDLG